MLSVDSVGDEFFRSVQTMVEGGSSYVDAIVRWCEDRGLEPEVGAEMAQKFPLIRSRLQMEAEDLRLIKSDGARLPI